MSVRLSASYPATDGSMPESVEIEWTDETPDQDLVHSLAGLLVSAASRRNGPAVPQFGPAAYQTGRLLHSVRSGESIVALNGLVMRIDDLPPGCVADRVGIADADYAPGVRLALIGPRWKELGR